jgi:hypothetical protein
MVELSTNLEFLGKLSVKKMWIEFEVFLEIRVVLKLEKLVFV